MIYAKSLPTTLISDYRASNNMKNITANIFKEIPGEYITLFVTISGDMSATNQHISNMKTKGDEWYFNDDGISIAILEGGYDASDWKKSAISRPFGVNGSSLRINNRPIFIPKVGKNGLHI